MKTIAKMGAGMGVLLRLGVQEPTREAVGSLQILAQLTFRVGFRLQYPHRAKYCIPILADKGVEPANIPDDVQHKGECYIEDGERNRPVKARWVNVKPWQESRVIKEASQRVPEFASCDYSEVLYRKDEGISVKQMLMSRRQYTIDEAPPGDSDVLHVDGYILRPPAERKAIIDAERKARLALPASDFAPATPLPRTQDGTQPAELAPASGDAVAGQGPTQEELDDAEAQARARAIDGPSPRMRRAVLDALVEAGPTGLSIKELTVEIEKVTGYLPSRGWPNKLMTEWRGIDQDKGKRPGLNPPVVIRPTTGSYVWIGALTPVEPSGDAEVHVDIDGDGIPDVIDIPRPPGQSWTPRLITNDDHEED
jgi:hypothetical protein